MKRTDELLVARLRTGDATVVSELLADHWDRLLRYAFGLLADWDKAEDVTQAAFVQMWARRDSWRDGSLRALLYRIVRNSALDVLKSPGSAGTPDALSDLVSPESPLATVEAVEFRSAATAAVEALPPRRREVYRLVREHGLSYERIAEITGLSRQTVANHMSLALSDLRTMLRPFLNAKAQPSGDAQATEGNG